MNLIFILLLSFNFILQFKLTIIFLVHLFYNIIFKNLYLVMYFMKKLVITTHTVAALFIKPKLIIYIYNYIFIIIFLLF